MPAGRADASGGLGVSDSSRWKEVLETFVMRPDRACIRCLTDMHSLWKCPLWWKDVLGVLRDIGGTGGSDVLTVARVEEHAVLNVSQAYQNMPPSLSGVMGEASKILLSTTL